MDIQREKDEMDAIEAREAEALNDKMRAQGYEKCKVCEHWVEEEDLTHGICESCIDNIVDSATLEDVMDYASTLYNSEDIVDNELVLYTQYLFDRKDVIELLKKTAKQAYKHLPTLLKREIREYIENDTGDYLDYLEEKGAL